MCKAGASAILQAASKAALLAEEAAALKTGSEQAICVSLVI